MAVKQSLYGGRPQQRDVARQQHQCAISLRENRFGDQQRMSGPKLWLLYHKREARLTRNRLADGARLVSDDDDRGCGREGGRRGQNMRDHRAASDGMQHFGPRGLHASALPRCKDDDVEVQGWSFGPSLSRCSCLERPATLEARHRGRLQSSTKSVVTAEWFEVRVVTGERPIFGVQRDRPFQMCDGFSKFAALRMGHGQHVKGVVVVRILVTDQTQMGDGFVVASAVDRKRGRIQPFVDRLRRLLARSSLPLTDVQIEPDTLVELLLVGVLPENRLEKIRCLAVIVSLQSFETALVEGYGVDVG